MRPRCFALGLISGRQVFFHASMTNTFLVAITKSSHRLMTMTAG